MSKATLSLVNEISDWAKVCYAEQNSLTKFIDTGADGKMAYGICAEKKRHYSLNASVLSKSYVPCNGACANGKIIPIEDFSPETLCHLGIYKRVQRGMVLVVEEKRNSLMDGVRHERSVYDEKTPISLTLLKDLPGRKSTLLQNGQSISVVRSLNRNEYINLIPVGARRVSWNDHLIIKEVNETIRNVNGKHEISSNEPELRAKAQAIVDEAKRISADAVRQENLERAARKKEFAKRTAQELKARYNLSDEHIKALFQPEIGPGQCEEAFGVARRCAELGRSVQHYYSAFFSRSEREERIIKGAEYILAHNLLNQKKGGN